MLLLIVVLKILDIGLKPMKKLNISPSLSNHGELKPGFDSKIISVFYIVGVMAREMEKRKPSQGIFGKQDQ